MKEIETRMLTINGCEIHCELRGRGEPLLLLHGLTGCSGDWQYAGRDALESRYQLIAPDARGHGRSTNPAPRITHRQCARDVLALLDALDIERCKAIGMSLGANTLLHVATEARERVSKMVLVSGTPYFPEQARALMRNTGGEDQPPEAWQSMRERHRLGDAQIAALWRAQRALADDYTDVHFSPPELGRIRARALIVYGDRDPLYPIELALTLYRAIPASALAVLPNAGHGPIFLDRAARFTELALEFLAADV
jgi:pimeloyl-ACP methyl ester carboxylesterase